MTNDRTVAPTRAAMTSGGRSRRLARQWRLTPDPLEAAMDSHPLRCQCGTLQGRVLSPRRAMGRGVCYCLDCQAYAHALGHPGDVLDAMGGTDVVAVTPAQVVVDSGRDALACLSLGPRGLLRWHTRCCATPLANTPRDWRIAYAGVVHSALGPAASLDADFGAARAHVNTKGAHGRPPSTPLRNLCFVARALAQAGGARLTGSYRRSPFFAEDGRPIVEPRVLTRDERAAARASALRNEGVGAA
jgi:hypothetical protein